MEEHLRAARAQIERRLLLHAIIALQTRQEDQHAIGGDEGRLAERRQEHAVEHFRLTRPLRDVLPEDHRRNADDHAGRQHRRDDDEIVERARARIDLRHHDGAGEPQRHRERDDKGADPQRVL